MKHFRDANRALSKQQTYEVEEATTRQAPATTEAGQMQGGLGSMFLAGGGVAMGFALVSAVFGV